MTVPALDLLRDYISYMSVRLTPDEWDEVCRALEGLAARVEQAERERDEIKDKFDHLHSEWTYERGRGDHLVYRREWEAFNRWQRGAEAQQALLADAIAYVRRNVGTDTPTSIEADLLARYEKEPT